MTRDEAKAWFEAGLATGDLPQERRDAFAAAVEALALPKFIAMKEGEVAVLEIDGRLSHDIAARIKESWERNTGTRCALLDSSIRLVGSMPAPPSDKPEPSAAERVDWYDTATRRGTVVPDRKR